MVKHSATVLQPSGALHQVPTQQYVTTAQHLPVPIPAELQQQIIQGEFIDFALLLHKTSFVETAQAQYTTQHCKHKPQPFPHSPCGAGMEHLSVCHTYQQCRTSARTHWLPTYFTSANQSIPLKAWLQYDEQFRTLAASNPHCRWNLPHPELWYEAMATAKTKRDSKQWPCPYCGAKNHFSENCPPLAFS